MNWTFESAVAVICRASDAQASGRLHPVGGKAGLDLLLGAELFLLEQAPETLDQAVALLDLAIANLAVGGRPDGRDLGALERIRTFLARS